MTMNITAAENAARTATLAELIKGIPLCDDAEMVVRDGFDSLADNNPLGFYGAIDQSNDWDHIGGSFIEDVHRALRAVAIHFDRADLAEEVV